MELTIRMPAVAGSFYPGEAVVLRKALHNFFQNTTLPPGNGPLKALIVPHAGYMYSGQIAAYGFAQLRHWYHTRKSQHTPRIILLGPAHTVHLQEVVADDHDYWETPLGRVKTLQDGFPKRRHPHEDEHCLEVEVPFLQHILDDFEILPLVTGRVDAKSYAQQLIDLWDDDTVLVISSDLSHYYDYHTAIGLDHATISTIENLDVEAFDRTGIACGKYPILIGLHIARKLGWKCRLLQYCNSGDVSGRKDGVVGYGAFRFYGS